MKKYRIIWTPQAKSDLRSIEGYISQFAPATAKAFIRRICDRVRTLVTLPLAAVPLSDLPRADLREVYVGSYRIIFRVTDETVQVLAVVHGARLLSNDSIEKSP